MIKENIWVTVYLDRSRIQVDVKFPHPHSLKCATIVPFVGAMDPIIEYYQRIIIMFTTW